LGHALKALSVRARQQGRGLVELAAAAGADLIAGESLKAARDLAWDEPSERQRALALMLSTLDAVEQWVMEHTAGGVMPVVRASLEAACQVPAQAVQSTEDD
jgi:hypothetical protein